MCPLGSANGAYVLPFLVCAELIAKRENAKRLLLYPEDRSTAEGGARVQGAGRCYWQLLCVPLFTLYFMLDLLCYI